MEDCELKTTQKQSYQRTDQVNTLELANKKHDDIWSTHKGTATQSNQSDRNIHVQTYKNNDEPTMEG